MIIKTFEEELKELLSKYKAEMIFEYDVDIFYSDVKVVNKEGVILYKEYQNSKRRIIIDSEI